MKKEVITPFEIKLEYKPDTENPSRLFRSFADIIESVNQLDIFISETVDSKISSKIYLNDIEKGSLIAILKNIITVSEDGKFNDIEGVKPIENYIEKSRAKTTEFLSSKKSTLPDLEKLSKDIEGVAKEEGIQDSFNYEKPDILGLAKVINAINDSTNELNEGEKYQIKSENTKVSDIENGTPKIDIETVEESLTVEEISNELIIYLKIKKPDFLSDSLWEFKYNNKVVKVKILDKYWLKDFQNGSIVVVPGDSLKVKIKQTTKYDKNGQQISNKMIIIEVFEVKRNTNEE